MKKKILKSLIFAFGIILIANCATIINGTSQEISVNSNVPGALVEMNGVELGYTPFKGKIGRGGIIKVSKPGYFAGDIELRKKRNYENLISGNIALGGASGAPSIISGLQENFVEYPKRRKEEGEWAYNDATLFLFFGFTAAIYMFSFFTSTDLSTGASWEYSPSSYYVQLKEVGQSSIDYSDELFIRYFATMNHSQIAMDASNNGEYAEALANIMETKMDGEAARQGINEALEESKGDQVMFGDALMERFRR